MNFEIESPINLDTISEPNDLKKYFDVIDVSITPGGLPMVDVTFMYKPEIEMGANFLMEGGLVAVEIIVDWSEMNGVYLSGFQISQGLHSLSRNLRSLGYELEYTEDDDFGEIIIKILRHGCTIFSETDKVLQIVWNGPKVDEYKRQLT